MAIGGNNMKHKTVIYYRDVNYVEHYEDMRDAFDELVNEALQKGWKPQGGVNVVRLNRGASDILIFSIGMVRED